MNIANIKTSELEVNKGQIDGLPKNPRFIRDERFNALKKSIEDAPEMLSLRELIVYPLNGKYVVIGGNMRLRACKDLGYKELPCKVLGADTPVEKLREYAIKDNLAFGQDDFDILANEWDSDELVDFGMEMPDFNVEDADGESTEAEEDDFDENTDEIQTICKPGDVWKLGEHRLMCGDSIDMNHVERLMGNENADLWLTDPPYNVAYEGGTKDKLTIMNDKQEDSKFRQFLVDAFASAFAFMKSGASFYIWHADLEGFNFRGACKDVGMTVKECLIWNKNSLVLGRQDYQWKHEPCLYGWKDGASHHWYSDRSQTTVLNFDKPLRNGEHPTMKPVALFAYLIKNSTKTGDVVIDSFGGSGTTLIACEQLGRKARIMELDPHYCDVIIARWEKLTGKKAELIN